MDWLHDLESARDYLALLAAVAATACALALTRGLLLRERRYSRIDAISTWLQREQLPEREPT
jgi:hypothetical protein